MDESILVSFAFLAMFAFLMLHTLVILALARSVVRLQHAIESGSGMEEAAVPEFVGVDVYGHKLVSSSLNRKRRAYLFVSTTCRSCLATVQEVAAVRQKIAGTVVMVCEGNREACLQMATQFGVKDRVVIDDGAIKAQFGVTSVPTAVLVGDDDRIKSVGSPSRDEIRGLVEQTASLNREGYANVGS